MVLVQREFFGQIIEQSRANPEQFLINFYTPLRIAPDRRIQLSYWLKPPSFSVLLNSSSKRSSFRVHNQVGETRQRENVIPFSEIRAGFFFSLKRKCTVKEIWALRSVLVSAVHLQETRHWLNNITCLFSHFLEGSNPIVEKSEPVSSCFCIFLSTLNVSANTS